MTEQDPFERRLTDALRAYATEPKASDGAGTSLEESR